MKLSTEQLEDLEYAASLMNTTKSNIVRDAIDAHLKEPNVLRLSLNEAEWEYLNTIASKNGVDAQTVLRLMMESYFILVNLPLSESIRPLGELREIFTKRQLAKKNVSTW